MATATKTAFNLKVLKRHDPSIIDIIDSASFVVLYNHQAEWTKTGVEGPMFLFRRDKAPYHGFFIMSRNGVENFSADMTPNDDLEITPEFIIYRPDSSSENDIYGIWIFESSQRLAIGEQMLTLQQMASPPPTVDPELAPPVPAKGAPLHESATSGKANANGVMSHDAAVATQPESISLDALFGSPTSAEATTDRAAAAALTTTTHEASLLDVLFQQASIQPPVHLAADVSTTAASQTAPEEATPDDSSQTLLALLGVKPAPPITVSEGAELSAPLPSTAIAAAASVASQGPGVENFAAARPASEQTEADNATKAPADPAAVNGTLAQAPKMSDLIAKGIKGCIGLGDDGQPLPRREFVRELLSLIHTESAFVDEIHQVYLERMSR